MLTCRSKCLPFLSIQSKESCSWSKLAQSIERVLVLSTNANSRKKKWQEARLYILLRSSQSFIHLHPPVSTPSCRPTPFISRNHASMHPVPGSFFYLNFLPLSRRAFQFIPLACVPGSRASNLSDIRSRFKFANNLRIAEKTRCVGESFLAQKILHFAFGVNDVCY